MRRLLSLIDRELTNNIAPTDAVVLNAVGKLKPAVATKERKTKAEELLKRHRAAEAMLNKHDLHAERAAIIAAAHAGAASIAEGGQPIPATDIATRYAEARAQARAAMEGVGGEVVALYLETAREALAGVHAVAEQRVQAERTEALALGLPYQPSGVAEALWEVRARIHHQIQKLENASPRAVNPQSLLGPLGLLPLAEQPEVRDWPQPKPTPPPHMPAPAPVEQLPPPELHFERRQRERQSGGDGGGIGGALRKAFGQ